MHAGCRYEVQCSGRVGQWSRAVAALQLDRGSSRTGWDVALCGLDPVLCFPLSIDVCLAVWEQFWCDRAGLVCGSWAFQRVRRRSCRRGPSAGKTYAYPEGYPQRFVASKRVNPFGSVLRRRRCFGPSSLSRVRPLVPFRLVKSGRDQDWDAVQGETWIGVVSSRFLLSSRTPSRTRVR